MAISSVSNSYLQQILFQNLAASTIQPIQLKNSAQLLTSARINAIDAIKAIHLVLPG
ncbi:MAG: hypothetical protein KKB51_13675 [Candidatus Riflebacteria bacterium]|nr:hypothetical protein [Candidatus Riflebacteria bacterium]